MREHIPHGSYILVAPGNRYNSLLFFSVGITELEELRNLDLESA